MRETANDRAVALGRYIVSSGSTVRAAAKVFKISKSTVHKDVTDRLQNKNSLLYEEVRRVLDKNKDERHIRGGIATKQKYLEKRVK